MLNGGVKDGPCDVKGRRDVADTVSVAALRNANMRVVVVIGAWQKWCAQADTHSAKDQPLQ